MKTSPGDNLQHPISAAAYQADPRWGASTDNEYAIVRNSIIYVCAFPRDVITYETQTQTPSRARIRDDAANS